MCLKRNIKPNSTGDDLNNCVLWAIIRISCNDELYLIQFLPGNFSFFKFHFHKLLFVGRICLSQYLSRQTTVIRVSKGLLSRSRYFLPAVGCSCPKDGSPLRGFETPKMVFKPLTGDAPSYMSRIFIRVNDSTSCVPQNLNIDQRTPILRPSADLMFFFQRGLSLSGLTAQLQGAPGLNNFWEGLMKSARHIWYAYIYALFLF